MSNNKFTAIFTIIQFPKEGSGLPSLDPLLKIILQLIDKHHAYIRFCSAEKTLPYLKQILLFTFVSA